MGSFSPVFLPPSLQGRGAGGGLGPAYGRFTTSPPSGVSRAPKTLVPYATEVTRPSPKTNMPPPENGPPQASPAAVVPSLMYVAVVRPVPRAPPARIPSSPATVVQL